MKRAKLRGLKRKAAVVLGNVGTAELLERARADEPDEMVREHAAWALERLRGYSDSTGSATRARRPRAAPAHQA